MNIKMS